MKKDLYIKPEVKTEILEAEVLMSAGSPAGGNPPGGGSNKPHRPLYWWW